MSENFYKEAFHYAMEELKKEFIENNKEDEFIMWFKMNYIKDTIDVITVSVASSFMEQMMIKKECFETLRKKLIQITGQEDIKINCIINPENKTSEEKEIKEEEKIEIKENVVEKENKFKKHPLLEEKFTFDTFIPGDNSNFAYNAAVVVAKNPGKQYNPILFYGGSGLGKTHLMQAIGNYIYNNGGENLKICYIPAENFINEFTNSIQTKKTNEFKNKYRNLDVLLMDDIHILNKKEQTQEELYLIFDALRKKDAQMVFICDRPIKEVENMKDRLVTRLKNGISIDLQPPDFETRCAILQKKTELIGESLSKDIIEYIANNVETNVRELEAALKQLFAYSDIIGEKPTLEMAQKQLANIFSYDSSQNISLENIQKVIADNYNISIADLKSKKKDKKVVIPRQIAIYISRELTEISYTELGKEFGGRDHTTIMHAYLKIKDNINFDSNLNQKIKLLIKEIKEYKKQ